MLVVVQESQILLHSHRQICVGIISVSVMQPRSAKLHALRRKLESRSLMATAGTGVKHYFSRLFYITDRGTNRQFLVDTGAEISVIPPSTTDRANPQDMVLPEIIYKGIGSTSYLCSGHPR